MRGVRRSLYHLRHSAVLIISVGNNHARAPIAHGADVPGPILYIHVPSQLSTACPAGSSSFGSTSSGGLCGFGVRKTSTFPRTLSARHLPLLILTSIFSYLVFRADKMTLNIPNFKPSEWVQIARDLTLGQALVLFTVASIVYCVIDAISPKTRQVPYLLYSKARPPPSNTSRPHSSKRFRASATDQSRSPSSSDGAASSTSC